MVVRNLTANGKLDRIVNQVGKEPYTLMLFAYARIYDVCLATCFLTIFTSNNKFNIQSFIVKRFALLFIVRVRGVWFESKPVGVV